VGALTDRHLGLHPWELDTTETICGFCDVGCTLNFEANRGLVRRVTHLWERGVNHGYTCERGRWGHEQIQSADRLLYPTIRQTRESRQRTYETTWDEAIDLVAESLAHYQGDAFATLVSPDSTNEEAYVAQLFGRAVMSSPHVDRYLSPAQVAVGQVSERGLGADVANTNNMQELFSDVTAGLVVGPNIGKAAPIASYWFYHSQLYREAKYVVISHDDYPLGWRSPLFLRPKHGTIALLLNGIAREIMSQGLVQPDAVSDDRLEAWRASLDAFGIDQVSASTSIAPEQIREAAVLYATGGQGPSPDGAYPAALIYQTVAHEELPGSGHTDYGDPAEIAAACINLAIITGNLGRPGGGIASPRGPANAQGTTDMGAHPTMLPGGFGALDAEARLRFEAVWMPHWGDRATTGNGFVPVRHLPVQPGLGIGELPAAIESGRVKAMIVGNTIAGRFNAIDPALLAALPNLDFLVVTDFYADTTLAQLADVVLPMAMSMEKDGTFTSFDLTVQRLRTSVPAMGEAKDGIEIYSRIAQRMGYGMTYRGPAQVMDEIAKLVPGYGGVTYARLERHGVNVPTSSYADAGTPILAPGDGRLGTLQPGIISTGAAR
jgi:formate dehydrogenase major subunit/formate dehydrogenase alpha subunit